MNRKGTIDTIILYYVTQHIYDRIITNINKFCFFELNKISFCFAKATGKAVQLICYTVSNNSDGSKNNKMENKFQQTERRDKEIRQNKLTFKNKTNK